jgi:hypothetical protein
MRYMVIVRLREPIVGDLVPAAQQTVAAEMQKALSSGKVAETGVFADERGGFMILNADSAEELFEFTSGLLDVSSLEVHPLISAERLGEFFQQQAANASRTSTG